MTTSLRKYLGALKTIAVLAFVSYPVASGYYHDKKQKEAWEEAETQAAFDSREWQMHQRRLELSVSNLSAIDFRKIPVHLKEFTTNDLADFGPQQSRLSKSLLNIERNGYFIEKLITDAGEVWALSFRQSQKTASVIQNAWTLNALSLRVHVANLGTTNSLSVK